MNFVVDEFRYEGEEAFVYGDLAVVVELLVQIAAVGNLACKFLIVHLGDWYLCIMFTNYLYNTETSYTNNMCDRAARPAHPTGRTIYRSNWLCNVYSELFTNWF